MACSSIHLSTSKSITWKSCLLTVSLFSLSLLITQLGWRYALLANCGITLFLFICGFLLKPIEISPEEFEDGISIYTDNSEVASSTMESNENLKNVSLLDQLFYSLRLFQNVSFSLFCINNVLYFGALTILWVHLNGYILKSGYTSSEAGWIYSIIGISNSNLFTWN